MFSLGRKCPACGAKELVGLSGGNGSPGAGSRRYLCQRCHQPVRCSLLFTRIDEQRRSPRLRLPKRFLLRIRDTRDHYGRIDDISRDGVGVLSGLETDAAAASPLEVDLYNCDDGSSLENLHANIISATVQHPEGSPGRHSTVRVGMEFVDLNEAQRKVLRSCLEQHGIPLDGPAAPPDRG